MSNQDVQTSFNVFDNNYEKGLGSARTLADLANMKYAVQNDSSLSADDKNQLLQDIASLEPLVGAAGQGEAWQNGVTQLVNDTTSKTGAQPTKVAADASTGGRVDTTLPENAGPFDVGVVLANGGALPPVSAQAKQMLSLFQQDPDKLSSLKQYVKSQASQSLMDAVLNALGNGSSNATSGSAASSSPKASAQAKVSAQASSSQDNGLTFSPGVVQTDDSVIPTVSSNLQLTTGGAQSGNGNTASLDGWDSNLGLSNPGNIDEFLMMVLLASYEDGQKGLEMMAKNLQKTNDQKKALRSQLAGLYGEKTGDENSDTGVNAQIENVQGQLSSASDDAQMQQLQLQNATQNQQQLLQELSAFSKNLYDASMNILRKIGS